MQRGGDKATLAFTPEGDKLNAAGITYFVTICKPDGTAADKTPRPWTIARVPDESATEVRALTPEQIDLAKQVVKVALASCGVPPASDKGGIAYASGYLEDQDQPNKIDAATLLAAVAIDGTTPVMSAVQEGTGWKLGGTVFAFATPR